jgi:hypothetical protein
MTETASMTAAGARATSLERIAELRHQARMERFV